jgi:hypothetical protein
VGARHYRAVSCRRCQYGISTMGLVVKWSAI